MIIKLQVFFILATKLRNGFLKKNINTSNLKNSIIIKFNNFVISSVWRNLSCFEGKLTTESEITKRSNVQEKMMQLFTNLVLIMG